MTQYEKDQLVAVRESKNKTHDPKTCLICRELRIPSLPTDPWVGSDQNRVFTNSLNPINYSIDLICHQREEEDNILKLMYEIEKYPTLTIDNFGKVESKEGKGFFSYYMHKQKYCGYIHIKPGVYSAEDRKFELHKLNDAINMII